MNNFRRILKQKCDSRSRMRGVNTHNKFQTPSTRRTGVISRKVSGTNKTKKNFFRRIFCWNFGGLPPMRGWLCIKNFSPLGPLEHKLQHTEVARNTPRRSGGMVMPHMPAAAAVIQSVTDTFSLETKKKHRRMGPMRTEERTEEIWL